MTSFAIFAFILTFSYVIYFAVMITLDLHAKPLDGKTDDVEHIDVEDMSNDYSEAPKVICEDSNMAENGMTYTDTITEDGIRVINPTGAAIAPEEDETSEPTNLVAEGTKKTTSDELNDENDYGTEDVEPEPQYAMYADDLYAYINKKHNNKREIIKENVRDHL